MRGRNSDLEGCGGTTPLRGKGKHQVGNPKHRFLAGIHVDSFPLRLAAYYSIVLAAALAIALSALGASQTVTLDGGGTGRVFEGLGAVSAGGAARLLIDYPEPYRSEILDYLFKPNYGASLQHLKVEIGGDEDSTDGSEPTHMRTASDQNYTRGYEWWLMQQAKQRNPSIKLDALEWGAPGWIGGGQFFSQDNINYILNFINGAKNTYGLTIDYVGIWNENNYNTTWIKSLKSALQADGLTTKVVAADQSHSSEWNIVNDMNADAALMSAVDVVGAHYVGYYSPPAAQLTGKPLWSSEDGPWRGDWTGAMLLAKIYNRNYIGGKITKTEIWSPVTSYYDILPIAGSGLMYANTPWSGNYNVEPAIWATAHTTQFAQPGWQYIDSSSGYLTGGGSYVTLKSGSDYSVVIETVDASSNQDVTFNIIGGLSTGMVHVWKTDATTQFGQQSDIPPVNGSFTITLAPGSIYSLTTTTGQAKGSAMPAAASAFPFPYNDTFDNYVAGRTPQYFSDISGAFETANCTAGRSGMCLRQVVTTQPILWPWVGSIEPATFIGSASWSDYQVSVDVLLEQPGEATLIGRLNSQGAGDVSAYQLYVSDTGQWSLRIGYGTVLSSGTVPFSLNTWHTMKLIFNANQIQGVIDNVTVTTVTDTTYPSGMAGLGVSGWTNAQFDNFRVDSSDTSAPVITQQPQSLSIGIGSTATFTVISSGAGLSYQWQSEPPGSSLFSSISGANSSSYTTRSALLTDNATQFRCVVSNNFGSDVSSPAMLTVTSPATATFVTADGATEGSWHGIYGVDGYSLANESQLIPAYASFVVQNASIWTWDANGTEVRDLQRSSGAGRIAATWYNNPTFDFDITFSDGNVHPLALYALDWDSRGRAETIHIVDGNSNAPLDTETISNFANGIYLVWNISGHVKINVTVTAGVNAVIGGVFFGGAAPINVQVNPSTATLSSSSPALPFTATVTGTNNTAVSWSVSPGFGAITQTGSYTPPAAVSTTEADVVTATSNVDPSKFGTAVITLVPPSPPVITQQPQSTTVAAGQSATFSVTASGSALSYQWQSEAGGGSTFSDIVGATSSNYTTAATVLSQSGTQFRCRVSNSIGSVTSNATTLTVSAPTSGTPFVTSKTLGTIRNNYTGWVGMTIRVGAAPITVTALGRMVAGTSTATHVAKIVQASNGVDLTGASATVTVAGGTPGTFVYTALASPVTLNANTSYYVVTQEVQGGDQWYDHNSTVQTTSVATVSSAVYSSGSSYVTPGSTGQTYGPVDFLYGATSGSPVISQQPQNTTVTAGQTAKFSLTASGAVNYQWQIQAAGASNFSNIVGATASSYTTGATQLSDSGTQFRCMVSNSNGSLTSSAATLTVSAQASGTAFVTSKTLGTIRNNYTGWVGMSIRVGAAPITVTALGRIVAGSSTGSHVVKVVQGSNGADLPGASVTVTVAGGTPGTFVYTALASPVTLNANTSYYVVTQEVQGGDQWYDYNSTVQTTSVATVSSAAYNSASSYVTPGSTGQTYGPVDFLY